MNRDKDSYMQTLASCLRGAEQEGFQTQFQVTRHGLFSPESGKTFQPRQIKVVHFYRFEGESDPGDSAILYALETSDHEKGTLVDGYGISNDSQVTDFMRQVVEIHK